MNGSPSRNFYKNLPVSNHFSQAFDSRHYKPLPPDWFVAATDIVNSTGAILNNRYRSVNIIGAAPIAALLKVTDPHSIPYIFCGDGAIICIPPGLYDETRRILATCKKIGKDHYDLDLRASLIPVSEIYTKKHKIEVARFQVSDHYIQALFLGSGIRFAENLLKTPVPNSYGILMPEKCAPVDFSALQCRWKEVKKPTRRLLRCW